MAVVANAIAWPTSILLMSVAMWLPRDLPHPLTLPRPPSFLLPGIAAALGLGILFIATLDPINHVATALAAATLVLVVGRTGFSVRSLRALTRERQRLAMTDHLTGLGNRRRLFEVLDGFFAGTRGAAGCGLVFLFIDLDGFKQVNDSFGHPVGDEVLKRVSVRLADSLRESDLLTRVGGDEFGAILLDAGAAEGADAARRLSASLKEPFTIDSVSAQIGASIGIALAPADAVNSADLVWCSDVAMYRAKLASSAFAFYEQDFDEAGNRLALADDLRLAIESEQLVLHYQPQLDLRTSEIVTLEALVRWQHPSLGLVAPLKFLPLAEEAGLMAALTRWVLAHALGQCAAWRHEGRGLTVSVNMSAADLLGPGFVETVTGLLVEHGLPPAALVLEITETTLVREFERSRDVVRRLRELGVLISIDDFGAGFTSLAYLSGLAVGELKLDRSFITPLAGKSDPRAVELVRATIELGHALRLRVVAEGVEDTATLGLVRRLGCDVAQGYCIGKPAPAHKYFWSGSVLVAGSARTVARAPTGLTARPRAGPHPVSARTVASEQAAAGRDHPQALGEAAGLGGVEIGYPLGAGARHRAGQIRPPERHGRDLRGPPSRGRLQLLRPGVRIRHRELAERLVAVADVHGAQQGVAIGHAPSPHFGMGDNPPLRIARSVSAERLVVGYGGRFHGWGAIVP